jgi:glycosyltransferase involved in cell wall biosynthesis
MIVKNESKIIERCLKAAKAVIDYVSIVDTGSTDNTKEIIENWCKSNDVPHKVHQETFKNFSHNRTHSYQVAKETFPDTTYFMLLDADMVLKVKPDFRKNSLIENSYLIMQYSRVVKYWNIRLIGNKNIEKWECIGVTHEYWQSTPDSEAQKLYTLEIDDREDGGCKDDKYFRDKRLLLEAYNDPDIPSYLKTRYSYYLGQTFECLRIWDEAAKWFEKRAFEERTWEEEGWYAHYKLGLVRFGQKQPEKAVATLLECYERRPWRAESLYKLTCYYRAKALSKSKPNVAMNRVALMFALQAKEIKYPREDVLFVEYDVYEFLIDVEICIVAYYVPGKKHIGKAAAKRLATKLKEGKIKDSNKRHVKETIRFYGF